MEDFFEFYYGYAFHKGFSVREDRVKYKPSTKEVTWRRFVYSFEGYRSEKHFERTDQKRQPRALTRCGCNARFDVQRSESSGIWYVTDFVDVHSHPFDKPEHAFVLRSHRGLNPYRSLEGGGSRAGAWWASSVPDHGCDGDQPRWSRRDWISFAGSVKKKFEAEEGKDTRE